MRVAVLFLVLAGCLALAANSSGVAPQRSANLQSPIGRTESPDAIMIPQMLSYQGKLTDTLGIPVPDGNYQLTFRLYTQATGGSAIWTEGQTIQVVGGLFSALLGSVTPISSVPDGGALYLSLQVAVQPELMPRLRIASSAFAYLSERAADADQLQGNDTVAFDARYVNEGQADAVTSAMVVNGTIGAVDLDQMGASPGQVMKWNGSIWVPANDSVGQSSGGTVRKVVQATGVVCSPNPIADSGTVRFDSMWGDARFVNEAQANSVAGAMIVDGTVSSADIRDTTVNTADLKDAAVTAAKLNQMGAATNQVLKWTGSAWAPRNDSLGTADNAWARGTPDSVLYTVRQLGIVRGGASNALYGNLRYTHTDFGVECTTGYSSLNYGYMAIGGGQGNSASAPHSTVSGGLNNRASGYIATVGGGQNNTASGDNATVGGGNSCNASWIYATVGGGRDNTASNSYSTVGGGRSNSVADAHATVAGGWSNSTSGVGATVGGGYSNYADSNYATIAGGYNNGTHGYCAAVGGGTDNNAVDDYATVGGGYWNYASGSSSTIPGGYRNYVYGDYATAIGGANDSCGGDYSLVAGSNVRVRGWAPYTFAFGENCSTSVPRAVVFYHSGAATKMGVGVQTPTHNIDVQGGAYCNGTNWVNGSSRRLKTDISVLAPGQLQQVLKELEHTQVVNYRYRSETSGEVHIGLIAEDAPELLATPERDGINTADAIGFLMAAVKAQQTEIEALKARLQGLK